MANRIIAFAGLVALAPAVASSAEICEGFGPQTPRDIASHYGENTQAFNLAPQPWAMNLCNIHTHTHAEHKGPGFSLPAKQDQARLSPSVSPTDHAGISMGMGMTAPQLVDMTITRVAATSHDKQEAAHGDASDHGASMDSHSAPKKGGWRCNETTTLSSDERVDPWGGVGPFGNVQPGDTIEVHWVYTTCDVQPGKGLGACVSDACANPQLRVESQVFLVVNDPTAASFSAFAHAGAMRGGKYQPNDLPSGTGEPVVFQGSTTGTSYDAQTCSPYQVTWSVRPYCMRLNLMSLHAWAAAGNVFQETASHGVRDLVTAPELLAPID